MSDLSPHPVWLSVIGVHEHKFTFFFCDYFKDFLETDMLGKLIALLIRVL